MGIHENYERSKINLQVNFFIFLVLITILALKNIMCQIINENLMLNSVNIDDTSVSNTRHNFLIGPCLINANNMCPDSEVTFYLYTRRNPTDGHLIFVNDTDSNLKYIGYDSTLPTKITVHGYNSDMQLDQLIRIKDEYLKKMDCNVIATDWSRYAVAPCYPFAVYNARHVGKCLAQLIKKLDAKNVHVLGFSLGAHVPAFAANQLRLYNIEIQRITGLDPAMPLFVTVNNDEKLDASDAEFVDVIHTNIIIQSQVALSGQVDFYMNGGLVQPGCRSRTSNPFTCDHHRSVDYFAESINSKIGFFGWYCSRFIYYLIGYCPPKLPAVLAGDDVNQTVRGLYFVKTNSASPFANGTDLFHDNPEDYEQVEFSEDLMDLQR